MTMGNKLILPEGSSHDIHYWPGWTCVAHLFACYLLKFAYDCKNNPWKLCRMLDVNVQAAGWHVRWSSQYSLISVSWALLHKWLFSLKQDAPLRGHNLVNKMGVYHSHHVCLLVLSPPPVSPSSSSSHVIVCTVVSPIYPRHQLWDT